MEPYVYDGIIVITPADFKRVKCLLGRNREYLPVRNINVVGSSEVGELVKETGLKDVNFINENDIIEFSEVEKILKERLMAEKVSRGITGWYYQQFLKMEYARHCKDEYYLVWDGDTVPCKNFSMFKDGTDKPYFDVKHEYEEEYFITMQTLLPALHKCIGKSFISEHMLINCDIMNKLILDIEKCESVKGTKFYEKVLYALRQDKINYNSFSEFETYGTYVALTESDKYMLREWHSLRYAGYFFKPEEMTEDDFSWLSIDFNAASFEKSDEYMPGLGELFSDKEYREKLSPHHIIQAIYDEGVISSNVVEKWD